MADEKKSDAPFNNPFAKLQGARAELPKGSSEPLVVLEPPKGPARAVVRREKKGHGGKEVTRVEKLELSAKDLAIWSQELKKKLGVGGSVEGEDLVFQGDQRERLESVLAARGVRKVTLA